MGWLCYAARSLRTSSQALQDTAEPRRSAPAKESAAQVGRKLLDEKELLRTQIKAYEFYAGLIDRAVGGGAQATLPRWDEQRALEYRALAEQLRRRLAELEAADQDTPASEATAASTATEAAPTVGATTAESGAGAR
jgi:hypothetical protein